MSLIHPSLYLHKPQAMYKDQAVDSTDGKGAVKQTGI